LIKQQEPVDLDKITWVFIINDDIQMSGGKVAAQVSNVSMLLPKPDSETLQILQNSDPCTLILAAPESYMLELIRDYKEILNLRWTIDTGLTEWTIGDLTCLGYKRELWMKTFTNSLPRWNQDYRKQCALMELGEKSSK